MKKVYLITITTPTGKTLVYNCVTKVFETPQDDPQKEFDTREEAIRVCKELGQGEVIEQVWVKL